MWSRLKSQADNALNIVNKSLQESTTSVFSSLTKSNYFDINTTNTLVQETGVTNNETTSNGIWNSILTNVKSVNHINSNNEDITKASKFFNLDEYFQIFYKNQMEDKEFTKWDLNVNIN